MPLLKEILATDTGYTAWATRQLLQVCSALTQEEIERDLRASNGSVLKTFRHIYYAERVWLQRLETDTLPPVEEVGDQRLFRDPDPEPSFRELEQKWPRVWEGYRRWLEVADESLLEGELSTLMPDGGEFRLTRGEIVVHAVNHSTLHRGQLIGLLRALGVKPPNTDAFSYYLAR